MRYLHVIPVVAAAAIAVLFFLVLPGPVYAEDLGTVNCGDTTTLLTKIDEANTNMEDDVLILFCSFGQTGFLLSDEIEIHNSGALTIYGTGASTSLIQTTVNRIFDVKNEASLTLNNIRLQNGNLVDGEGGTIRNRGVLTLNNVDIWNSGVSTGNGGAIYNKGDLIISGSDIFNATLGNGNGVALYSAMTSTVTWADTDVRFSTLTGTFGNGIVYNTGAFDLIGRSMSGNVGTEAIYNSASGVMILDDLRISFNDDAGIENHGQLMVIDSEINDNGDRDTGTAGGLKNYGIVDVFGTDLRNNWFYNAYNGLNAEMTLRSVHSFLGNYGVQNVGGILGIEDSEINNISIGIVQNGGSLSVQRSAISEGTTGIAVLNGDVYILRSGIYDNTGTGITFNDGTLLVEASTISGNMGLLQTGPDTFDPTEGGGLAIYQGQVSITDSTIVDNSAREGGGLWVYSDDLTHPHVTLQNTIVAGNSVSMNFSGNDILGPVTLNGVNFIGTTNGAETSGSVQIMGGNPLLAPLALNGGIAQSHLPYPNSPVIDAGFCSTTALDQRGKQRPFDQVILPNQGTSNGCDIGAIERDSFADAVPTTNSESYVTPYQTPITVPAPGVLANDSILNPSFVLTLFTDVKDGTLELSTDGSFTYTPDEGFVGTDFFTYTLRDESVVSNIATVVINVSPSENVPPVGHIDIYSVEMNNTLNVAAPGVLANDVDVDSDRVVLRAIKISDPVNGFVTMNTDGSFAYTPSSGFTGSDVFEYLVSDGIFESEPTTVAINIVPEGSLTQYGPAPVNLHVSGNFNRAPVLLTFSWQNTLGDVTAEQWYHLSVVDEANLTAFESWFPATEICGMDTCNVQVTEDLLPALFTNGYYRWKVYSWDAGLFSLSSVEEDFTISVPTASLFGSSVNVEVDTGRLAVIFPDSPYTAWVQVYVGTPEGQLRHLRWYSKDGDLCTDQFCTLYPDVSLIAGNYHLWVQVWGPGGYGMGDVITPVGGWAGPIAFTIAPLVPGPATPLTPAYVDSGRPEFNWLKANGAIWYQIWVFNPNDLGSQANRLEWVNTLDAGCITTLTCTWTPDFVLENNRTYEWMLQGWGPGGFASNGNPGDPLDSLTTGGTFTVNASPPDVPLPITPTNLVTNPTGLTFTWAYDPQVSWYEFEIRQTNALPASVEPLLFDNWYSADAIGCREQAVCVLKVDFVIPNGKFEWRLRPYNPAVTQLLQSAWSPPQAFRIQR